ncbi:putative short chain dehydrogenase [Corynespora cassiicola Philippines]|uniref:Putative short chain dehydrogenase n=1 Tax=Corynespora cassiicola Philippines TaxID=1448308 RepID=A0A2T2NU48_CORCC|nr:putative short chain dehydrogenase [Corynespora cassiicola Philippines]
MTVKYMLVIVGGTHGIGLETAKLLLSKGASVLISGRIPENLKPAKSKLETQKVATCECDITSLDAIRNLLQSVSDFFGIGPQIDVLFVNAGYAHLEPFVSVTEESFKRTFNTNVFGAFFVTQHLIPAVKPGGAIVFTTSVANRRGYPGMVNAVSPGYIKTPTMGVEGTSQEVLDAFAKLGAGITPLKRIGMPEEVARTMLHLGYEATFSTGTEILVDGGLVSLGLADH